MQGFAFTSWNERCARITTLRSCETLPLPSWTPNRRTCTIPTAMHKRIVFACQYRFVQAAETSSCMSCCTHESTLPFVCKQETLHYDKVLVATGGTPRKLFVPGSDMKNIFTLRLRFFILSLTMPHPHTSLSVVDQDSRRCGKDRAVGQKGAEDDCGRRACFHRSRDFQNNT